MTHLHSTPSGMPSPQRTVHLAVVSAGLGVPSSTRLLADRLTEASRRALEQSADGADGIQVVVDVVELRTVAHAITDHMLTGFPPAALRETVDVLGRADAVIAVTPTFNASYSGLFKAFFDALDEGTLAGKPVLLGATGGTARHSLVTEHAMRPMFSYLHAAVTPTAVYAASEDWGGDSGLPARIERAGRELATQVLATPVPERVDEFASVTSFEALLAGRA